MNIELNEKELHSIAFALNWSCTRSLARAQQVKDDSRMSQSASQAYEELSALRNKVHAAIDEIEKAE